VAIYRSSTDSPNLGTHLGSPVLAGGDEVQVEKYAQDFTAGCDLSGTDLVKVIIGPGSSSRFLASNGGQLKITANRTSTGRFINNTSADQVELASSSAAGVIYNIENRPKNQSSILRVGACDANNIYQITGTMVQQSDADFNVVFVLGGRFLSKNGSAAVTTLHMEAGVGEIERDAGTVNARGGTLTINHTAFTPGTVNLDGAAVIKVLETGNWGALNGYSGTIDLTECKSLGSSSGYLFTISSGTLTPGLVIRQNRGGLLPDISGCTLVAGGPRYEFI
jgi:hypothetical protein